MPVLPNSRLPDSWDPTDDTHHQTNIDTYEERTGWFVLTVRQREDGQYTVAVSRGPDHPHQSDLDEPLRAQHGIDADAVEYVAPGFMLAASDLDPFTNQHSRGYRV